MNIPFRFLLLSFFLCSPVYAGVVCDEVDDFFSYAADTTLDFPDGDWTIGINLVQNDDTGSAFQYFFSFDQVSSTGSSNWFFNEATEASSPGIVQFQIQDDDDTKIECNSVTEKDIWGTRRWLFASRDSVGGTINHYTYAHNDTSLTTMCSKADTGMNAATISTPFVCTRTDKNVNRYANVTVFALFKVDALLSTEELSAIGAGDVHYLPTQYGGSNLKLYTIFDEVASDVSADGVTFLDRSGNGNTATGDDGANNTGLTGLADEIISYP